MQVSAPAGSIEAGLQDRVEAFKKKLEGEQVPLLQTEYLGDAVERLLACFPRDQTNPQLRSFVALVQATLSGKTRLLLELVYKMLDRPIILIRLLATSNAVYNDLIQHLANNAVYDNLSFEQRRDHNRRMMLKIRIFFFCYMRFTEYFLQAMGRERWGKIDKWRVDSLRGDDLKKTKSDLLACHRQLSEKLGTPYFVLDECHTPQQYFKGCLFHSDYNDHLPEDVIAWQLYEMRQEGRGPPPGYPYHSRTDLFWAFRWVVTEYLKMEQPQVTIFTSTHFSAWEPLLDSASASRERPNIIKFFHLHDLTVGEMLATIRHHIPGLEKLSLENTTQLERMLKRWTGRPGFFFEFLLPHLRKLKPETDDFQSIEANEQEARKLATEFIKLLIREYELRHPSSTTLARAQQLTDLIHFSLLLCNKRLTGSGIHLADVVEIGYARVKRYKLDTQHIEAVISDPLVEEALVDNRNNAYLNADRHLQHEFGTNLAVFAEHAIALQLLQRHDTELGDLISEWCDGIVRAPTQVLRLLRSAKVCALTAGRMDDFKIPSAEFLRPDILQDKVILAKTGLCLPDILFTAQTDQVLCLCSIQVKTWRQRLPPDSFSEAIHSTSRDWFLKQKRKVQLDNHAHLQKLWQDQLELLRQKSKSVCHIRFIVSWSGFTHAQVTLLSFLCCCFPTELSKVRTPGSKATILPWLSGARSCCWMGIGIPVSTDKDGNEGEEVLGEDVAWLCWVIVVATELTPV
ncbi:hypothetical protein QOT17_014247 [Balamuthia mandrillaris]